MSRIQTILGSSDEPKLPSNRSFGLWMAAFFAFLGFARLIRGGNLRPWALGISAALMLLALSWPRVLGFPNRIWARFGQLLQKIMQPILMALIFGLVITPFALVMRLVGRDALRLRIDRGAKSYWLEKNENPDSSRSMTLPY